MPGQPRSVDGRSNPWLDLVRTLAIVLVLLRHGEIALHGASPPTRSVLETIFVNGWIGVDLFFVLSGYLIARHLMRAGVGERRFKGGRYLAMRGLRILPAYLFVLTLILFGWLPFYDVPDHALALRVGYHLLFFQDYLPSNINVVFWSLGVEEKFYMLAPFVMLALLRCRNFSLQLVLLLGLFAAPLLFRTLSFQQLTDGIDYPHFFVQFRSPFHMTLEGLVLGMGIAIAERAGLVPASRKAGIISMALASGVLLVWLGSHEFMAVIGSFDATAQPTLIALLSALLTVGAVQLAYSEMPLAPPVRIVARLSYCLYLIHFPLIPLALALSADRGSLAFWTCYFAASFVAAILLHLGVERPFLAWKDRLAGQARTEAIAREFAVSERELRT